MFVLCNVIFYVIFNISCIITFLSIYKTINKYLKIKIHSKYIFSLFLSRAFYLFESLENCLDKLWYLNANKNILKINF